MTKKTQDALDTFARARDAYYAILDAARALGPFSALEAAARVDNARESARNAFYAAMDDLNAAEAADAVDRARLANKNL